MKTIDEAAKEAGLVNRMAKTNIENAFKSGAEFAQRWIPVDEELPEINETVLINNRFDFKGVGCFDGSNWKFYTIEHVDGCLKCKKYTLENFTKITHWRPIELK